MHLIRTLVLGLFMLAPAEADAEAFRGSVKDESGAAIAGATVTVMTARQAVVATTVSDASGAFSIGELPAGEYVVQVEAPGFSRQRIAATVFANAPPASIVLTIDAVREDITVTASPGQAIDCFLRTQMDVLVIGNHVLERARSTAPKPEPALSAAR